jgi:hypothetical protein
VALGPLEKEMELFFRKAVDPLDLRFSRSWMP